MVCKHLFSSLLQEIDYESFRRFLDAFLDYETPEDLSKHLFISFLSPQITQLEQQGKIFNQMAAISTQAACAPVTSHSRGNECCKNKINHPQPLNNNNNLVTHICFNHIHIFSPLPNETNKIRSRIRINPQFKQSR